MSDLADKVQQDLVEAIDNDDLVCQHFRKWHCRFARRQRTLKSVSAP